MQRKYKKMHLLFEESASCLSINLETNTVFYSAIPMNP